MAAEAKGDPHALRHLRTAPSGRRGRLEARGWTDGGSLVAESSSRCEAAEDRNG